MDVFGTSDCPKYDHIPNSWNIDQFEILSTRYFKSTWVSLGYDQLWVLDVPNLMNYIQIDLEQTELGPYDPKPNHIPN